MCSFKKSSNIKESIIKNHINGRYKPWGKSANDIEANVESKTV